MSIPSPSRVAFTPSRTLGGFLADQAPQTPHSSPDPRLTAAGTALLGSPSLWASASPKTPQKQRSHDILSAPGLSGATGVGLLSQKLTTSLTPAPSDAPVGGSPGSMKMLLSAASRLNADEVHEWMSLGLPLDVTGVNGTSPLHYASSQGSLPFVSFLLSRGANPEVRESKAVGGSLPLHNAVRGGHADVVKVLIEAAPETVNSANGLGQASIHLAARLGHVGIVRLLIEMGADVNALDSGGKSAWWWAHDSGHAKLEAMLPKIEYDWMEQEERRAASAQVYHSVGKRKVKKKKKGD